MIILLMTNCDGLQYIIIIIVVVVVHFFLSYKLRHRWNDLTNINKFVIFFFHWFQNEVNTRIELALLWIEFFSGNFFRSIWFCQSKKNLENKRIEWTWKITFFLLSRDNCSNWNHNISWMKSRCCWSS